MPTDRTRTSVAITLAGMLFLAGCADRRAPGWEGATPAEDGSLSLNVTNDHFNDVVVYAGRVGSWRRIGMVGGLSSARLDIPRGLGSVPGRIQLRVHAIGVSSRADYVTDVINADPGDVIELAVASTLRMSHWWIRGPG